MKSKKPKFRFKAKPDIQKYVLHFVKNTGEGFIEEYKYFSTRSDAMKAIKDIKASDFFYRLFRADYQMVKSGGRK